jgi:hypothetical protein
MKEVHIYRSFWKNMLLVLGSGIFVGAGFFILIEAESEDLVMAWTCILLFGFCLAASLYLLFNKKPLLSLNEVGIQHKALKKALKRDTLEWEAIQGARILSVNGNKMLVLEVDQAALPAKKSKSRFAKGLQKINNAMGGGNLTLPLGLIGVKPKVLVTLVQDLANTEKSRRANELRTFEQQYL